MNRAAHSRSNDRIVSGGITANLMNKSSCPTAHACGSTTAMLLSGEGALTDNFNITEASERAGVLWVRMQPKRNDTDFKAVRLGFAGNKAQELKFMELADKLGQTTLLEFS